MNEKREKEVKERINDKINNIEKNLQYVTELKIPEFEDYKNSLQIKLVCERLFEMIIEDIISIAFLIWTILLILIHQNRILQIENSQKNTLQPIEFSIIREKKLTSPENEEHAFIILANHKIINPELAQRLKEAKDMRNRIIHNYITIDDLIVYNAIVEELPRDAEEFVNAVVKR